MSLRLALALVFLPLAAVAQELLPLPGRVSDGTFYRAVACGAAPGEACQEPMLRWKVGRPIRVALRAVAPAYLGRRKLRAEASLSLAVQALNAASTRLRLVRVEPEDRAEIEIFLLDQPDGATIAGTGIAGVDGALLGATTTRLQIDPETGRIARAAILFSTSLETADYEAAMLQALARAMGLMHLIVSPSYDGRSVFARGSGRATALGPQDIMALKRHYARD